jgi:hypothetical protein
MNPIDELATFFDLGGARFGQANKYARRLPLNQEAAVQNAACVALLKRLEVGKSMTISRVTAARMKSAAPALPGLKVSVRKVDEATATITRTA